MRNERIRDEIMRRADELYREWYVFKMKHQLKATGWEDADVDSVSHLSIDDPKIAAVVQALVEFFVDKEEKED